MLTPREPVLFPQTGSSSQAGSNGSQVGSTAHAGSTTSQAYNSPQAARARVNSPGDSSRLPPQNRGNTLEDPNIKCVINLSSKPLTQAQRSVLAKDPNFMVSLRHPPKLEYITAIVSVCTKLGQQDAEELRADINRVLRSSQSLNMI